MMTRAEIADWATAYIEAQMIPKIPGNHPLWWAIHQFMLVDSTTSPEDCWLAILEILSRKPPQQVMQVLAAGALEDLITHHGPEFIERIELEARRNSAFRHLLGGVWRSSTPEVWTRVEQARGKSW